MLLTVPACEDHKVKYQGAKMLVCALVGQEVEHDFSYLTGSI